MGQESGSNQTPTIGFLSHRFFLKQHLRQTGLFETFTGSSMMVSLLATAETAGSPESPNWTYDKPIKA